MKKINKKKTLSKKEVRPVGRPVAYQEPKEMANKIEEYFTRAAGRIKDHITSNGLVVPISDPAPVHVTGLCVFLGISRDTLCEYQKKPNFSDSITRAKLRCEEHAVNACFEGKKGNKADFVLQNNFGWKNKSEVDNKGSMTVKTVYIDAGEKESYEDHINQAIKEH